MGLIDIGITAVSSETLTKLEKAKKRNAAENPFPFNRQANVIIGSLIFCSSSYFSCAMTLS